MGQPGLIYFYFARTIAFCCSSMIASEMNKPIFRVLSD